MTHVPRGPPSPRSNVTDNSDTSDVVCLLTASNNAESASYTRTTTQKLLPTSHVILTPCIVESECTSRMTFNKAAFSDYSSVESVVHMGTDVKAYIAITGSVYITVHAKGNVQRIKLRGVLHIPSFRLQLLSVAKPTSLGVNAFFSSSKCPFRYCGSPLVT